MSMSNYLENKLQDHLWRGIPYTAPTTLYFAMMTTAVADDNTGGVEITGGSYARVAIPAVAASFLGTHGTATGASSGTDGQIDNAIAITFPTPSADWGQAVAWALFDAASGGNLLLHDVLTNPKNINTGDDAPSWPIAGFKHTLDG